MHIPVMHLFAINTGIDHILYISLLRSYIACFLAQHKAITDTEQTAE